MQPKQKLDLSEYNSRNVTNIDDLTLRNIIYQVYGEWNSTYSRKDLESIGQDALCEAGYWKVEAQADKELNMSIYGAD